MLTESASWKVDGTIQPGVRHTCQGGAMDQVGMKESTQPAEKCIINKAGNMKEMAS